MAAVDLKPATPESSNWNLTLLLGVVVAIDVGLKVFLQWSHYNLEGKLIAGILVLNLLILVLFMFQRNRPGSRVGSDALLMISLVCLLLATMAFNQHLK
jgi:hypothetical protein